MGDSERITGLNRLDHRVPKKKKKKATKKVASKKLDEIDKDAKTGIRKKVLVFVVIFIFIICGIAFLSFSDVFKVSKFEIQNNSRVTEEEIINIGNFNQYVNIFWVTNCSVSNDLLKNAYIESVKIHKKFPNKLIIDVKERIPKYMLQIADSYVYINNQGYLLEVSTENLGLPIILGFKTDLSNVELGKRLDVEDLKKMDKIIKIVETAAVHNIDSIITKVDISNERNYTLILETEGKTVYLGDVSELNTKMIYLSGILKREKGVQGEIFLNMNLNTDNAFFREKI